MEILSPTIHISSWLRGNTLSYFDISHFQEVNSAYSLCGCEMLVRGLNIARNILWFITVERDVTKYLPAKRAHALYTAVNS